MTVAVPLTTFRSPLASDVAQGLGSPSKRLPAYLFYDELGSQLYERITTLPEYYLTRTERTILERYVDRMVELAARGSSHPLRVVELGAGTADKTRLILDAVVRRQGPCAYLPIDVSASALHEAKERIEREVPQVLVQPFVGQHQHAFGEIRALGPRRLVLFIGSSIGNFEDDEAVGLLAGVRRGLAAGGTLLLGTDLRKDPGRMIPAYDDAQGVTAAFNKNVLARINRELGANFDLDSFEHVARWNERASRIEMHLRSRVSQRVYIEALETVVHFDRGETIHTESSIKYDQQRVEALLERAGFVPEATFVDDGHLFAVHLARAVSRTDKRSLLEGEHAPNVG